jgi:hypothetical protein
MPKKKLIPLRRGTRSIEKFTKIDPLDYTPSDSPIEGPETKAIKELQKFANDTRNYFAPQPAMSLFEFLNLCGAMTELLHARIISRALAQRFAALIARRYHFQGRWC